MAGPLVDMENVSKVYWPGGQELRAVDSVSLTIQRGEFLAIMGPSGSGKSTLLNLLRCLDQPSSGRHLFDGADVSGLSATSLAAIRNRYIGFVFQSYNLLPRATALENVELPMLYRRVPEAQWRGASLDILRNLGLDGRYSHFPSQLSGGEQQRVAIARAVAVAPDMILADEPTGSPDSRAGAEILTLLQNSTGRG